MASSTSMSRGTADSLGNVRSYVPEAKRPPPE
jgi:hypothetical protein